MKLSKKGLRIIGVILILAMMLTSIPFFTASAEVSTAVRVYIDAPKAGRTPDYTAEVSRMSYCTVANKNTGNYKNGVCWYVVGENSSITPIKSTDKFEAGKKYMVRIELVADDYFKTSGDRIDVDAYVNDNLSYNCDGYDAYEIWVDYYFPICVEEITSVALDGIVMPTVGKTPTFAKINTTKYESKNNPDKITNQSNGVVWANMSTNVNLSISNTFKEGTKYALAYTLYPKTGYSFALDVQVTINGQTATVSHKGSYIMVMLQNIVPKSNKQDISTLSLTVTAPTAGNKPGFDKIQGTGYYSDNGGNSPANYKNGIMWYNETSSSTLKPGTTATFAENNKYSVTVVVMANDTHKFASAVTAKVNGKTATVERIDDDTVIVKYTFAKLPVSHTHTESGWKTDGTHHWKVCTDPNCGVVTTTKTAHSGGTATCTAKAKCAVCGVEYGKTTAHIAGAEPTETSPQTCTKCGVVIKPALNHTHKLSKVSAKEATCTEPGNKEHYACSGCPELFNDANGNSKITDRDSVIIAPKGHTGSDWKNNESFHWQECTTCGVVLNETKMLHEDADENGKCDTCGYEQGIQQEPTTAPTEQSTTAPSVTTTQNGDNNGNSVSTLTWIIIGAGFVVVLAALIVVIILAKKKK